MPLKIEREEDRQVPRWVHAMMKANQDPLAAEDDIADNPLMRNALKLKAEEFYKKRQDRLKEMSEASSRITGMEWKHRPKTTFSSDELDKIIPTRRVSYIVMKAFFIGIVSIGVLAATSLTVAIGAACCAEIKLHGSFGQAWSMFTSSPSAYIQRVEKALNSDDGS